MKREEASTAALNAEKVKEAYNLAQHKLKCQRARIRETDTTIQDSYLDIL